MMFVEVGHFALVLLLGTSLLQFAVSIVGAGLGWTGWMRMAVPSSAVLFALSMISFGTLVMAFVRSDFSVALVVANSHSAKPILYKIAGVWGNHEGSMLLWVLILNLYGAMVGWRGCNLPLPLQARVLGVQASISAAFTAYILFASNPFRRLTIPPFDGRDLNPLLQDPGLAFHPPFLYLGYVGLSVSFCFAVAALLGKKVDAAWARWVRPWTLASWSFLTLGIAMGSWWAYYELGWGGWWFWDPVENASFMPWLAATALLHSAAVVEKRECLLNWTVFLCILGFTLSLIGTFLVRSGIITSVHAFASDPTRGIFILIILGVFSGGGFLLYALRSNRLVPTGAFGFLSRESALVVNNVLLVVALAVVFLGTFWPVIMEMALGRTVSVGAPFFNAAFTPFMVVLFAVLPLGAILRWKRASPGDAALTLVGALAVSMAVGAFSWVLQTGGDMLGPVGLLIATWLIAGSVTDLYQRAGGLRGGAGAFFRRALKLSGADWGKLAAHAGLGVSVAGIAAITAWQVEDIRTARPGEAFELGSQRVEFIGLGTRRGPNYSALYGTFSVGNGDSDAVIIQPERRYYEFAGSPTTEAGIDSGFLRDIYIVIGEVHDDGSITVKSYVNPLVNWIWLGAVMMALGGAFSLIDRRYRVAGLSARLQRKVSAAGT